MNQQLKQQLNQHLKQHLNQHVNQHLQPEPKPEPKRKRSPLKLRKETLNKIEDEGKNINDEIFSSYFGFYNPSILVKELFNEKEDENDKIVNDVNDSLTDLKKDVKKGEIPKNGNPEKISSIAEKILNFNNQEEGIAMKILTPIQMFQRLPTVLTQVKAGNTSENLLNEIRQIIYSLYRAKEINKIVYNNIMNSIKL